MDVAHDDVNVSDKNACRSIDSDLATHLILRLLIQFHVTLRLYEICITAFPRETSLHCFSFFSKALSISFKGGVSIRGGILAPYLMILFFAGEQPYMCTLSWYTYARAQ